jgi:two-component system nitrogen regulation response regulator NtrX
MPIKILVIDDEFPIREVLSASLRDEGHTVLTAPEAESGLRLIKEFQPDLVFLDIWMPGSLDGIQVLTMAKKQHPNVEFIMISGHGNIETAVKATKLGAWDFIEKPLSMDKILIGIGHVVEFQAQRAEKETLLNRLRRNIALVGDGTLMMSLKQAIADVAFSAKPIALVGEDGVGKNLVAQNIHYSGARAGRPFVEVNCLNLNDDLAELDLFGYEAGFVPGAEKRQKGKVELAAGGTLIFEHFDAISPSVLAKLQAFFEQGNYSRKGSSEVMTSDVRIITSSKLQTSAHGKALVSLKNEVRIEVPSLREHKQNIPALTSHFSDMIARESSVEVKEFAPTALGAMSDYSWPGNVRELRNFIERVYILTPTERVELHDVRFAGLPSTQAGSSSEILPTFREARAQFEKEFLIKKLQENNGNISKTAEVIGLERSYLHRKIKSYGIESQKGNEDSL